MKNIKKAMRAYEDGVVEELKNIKKAMRAYEDDPEHPDMDPLEYWRSGAGPKNHWLRLCAQHMLSIPGSSSAWRGLLAKQGMP